MDVAAQDAEANAFAMELLMPFDWIVRDSAKVDLTDDIAIANLAKKYRVPASVMAARIHEIRGLADGSQVEPRRAGSGMNNDQDQPHDQ